MNKMKVRGEMADAGRVHDDHQKGRIREKGGMGWRYIGGYSDIIES